VKSTYSYIRIKSNQLSARIATLSLPTNMPLKIPESYPERAAIAYTTSVIFVFAAQLSDLLLYGLRLAWTALSITVAVEVLSRALFNTYFVSQMTPRQYHTPSKMALETITGSLAFESQRLLFSEDIFVSGAVRLLFLGIIQGR
jgi:hypothetical protein